MRPIEARSVAKSRVMVFCILRRVFRGIGCHGTLRARLL